MVLQEWVALFGPGYSPGSAAFYQGYSNMGKTPSERLNGYLEKVNKGT